MISELDAFDEEIDWALVKQQLAAMQDSLKQSDELSAEKAEALMEERARLLARVPDTAPDTDNMLEVMTIRLGQECFAIETRLVREVYRPTSIMPLPESPDFLVGLTNLRGEVLAVLDLGRLFELDSRAGQKTNHMVVLGGERAEFGILVVDVGEVRTLHFDEILAVPDSVANIDGYLRGVTEDAVCVIDGDALLGDERLYMNQSD